MFQSLLFEACGRTVNPVNGAVGLLWTGNWHVCQAAVDTVLRGGILRPMPDLIGLDAPTPTVDDASEGEVTCTDTWRIRNPNPNFRFTSSQSKVTSGGKRKRPDEIADLNLRLSPSFLHNSSAYSCRNDVRRPGTPSMNSEESVTTTACLESRLVERYAHGGDRKILNLFIWGFFSFSLKGSHARVVQYLSIYSFFECFVFEKRVFPELKSGEIDFVRFRHRISLFNTVHCRRRERWEFVGDNFSFSFVFFGLWSTKHVMILWHEY